MEDGLESSMGDRHQADGTRPSMWATGSLSRYATDSAVSESSSGARSDGLSQRFDEGGPIRHVMPAVPRLYAKRHADPSNRPASG